MEILKLKTKEDRAPSPTKGNAKAIFAVIDEYDDPLTETEISRLIDTPIKHRPSVSAASAFKSSLRYLVTFGYVDMIGKGKGAKYQISTAENHRARYEKYEASRWENISTRLESELIMPDSDKEPSERGSGRRKEKDYPVWPLYIWMTVISLWLLGESLGRL